MDNTKWFGNTNNGYSVRLKGPIAGIKCDGSFCESLKLRSYRHMKRGGDNIFVGAPKWTSWFSSTDWKATRCPENMLVSRMQCKGRSCDKMRLQCKKMKPGYRINQSSTANTKWISEQNGISSCEEGRFVQGMKCRGKYCSEVRLLCAEVEYEQIIIGDFRDEKPDVCIDMELNENSEWQDSDEKNCDWYSNDNHCDTYGNDPIYENFGLTANEVCCACGGGSLSAS